MASTAQLLRGGRLRAAPFTSARPQRVALTVEANKRRLKKQSVVLMDAVPSLGEAGSLHRVQLGFFRNYLKPAGLAKLATDGLLNKIQREKEEAKKKQQEVKAQAQAFANAIATIGNFTLSKNVGANDQIFGSVKEADVAALVSEATGRTVDPASLELPEVKTTGTYEVAVKLHPEVTATFNLVVAKASIQPETRAAKAAKDAVATAAAAAASATADTPAGAAAPVAEPKSKGKKKKGMQINFKDTSKK